MLNFFFLCLFSLSARALPPESHLMLAGSPFSFFTSHALSIPNNKVEKAIIVVHGSERNADTYYNGMSDVTRIAQKLESTIIIAPHYKLTTDILLPHELTWTDEGWLSGDAALTGSKISAFSVIDQFISLLANKENFPHLKTIIVTGHSAGGQLTQRYAVGSREENKHQEINFRYIVLNPGSYLYLSSERPVLTGENCAYNNYKYGLEKLNIYMGATDKAFMVRDYLKRDVIYLVGALDTVSSDIDQTCPARYQGENRNQRAHYFFQTLTDVFGTLNHKIFDVPGVAHTQHGMYHSPVGMNVLWQD